MKRKKIIEENKSTQYHIRKKVTEELSRCIECNRCLEQCPIVDEKIQISDLNKVTKAKKDPSKIISDFIFSCFQCGHCVPVCPVHLHRDQMMLLLKHNFKKNKPWSYRRYLLIRGPHLSILRRILQKGFIFIRKLKQRDLSSLMETVPSENEDLLFYPGCYIYSPQTIQITLKLLDHVGNPYGVLGGLTTCCGVPQLLQGEFDLADEYFKNLLEQIQRINPKRIITNCAECLEALIIIKERYHQEYQVSTVTEYLVEHIHLFPSKTSFEHISLLNSCRLSLKYDKNKATKHAIEYFSVSDKSKKKDESFHCCFHWNHNTSRNNIMQKQAIIHRLSTESKVIACDCLTCFEEYKKMKTSTTIIDILDLFAASIDENYGKDEL